MLKNSIRLLFLLRCTIYDHLLDTLYYINLCIKIIEEEIDLEDFEKMKNINKFFKDIVDSTLEDLKKS